MPSEYSCKGLCDYAVEAYVLLRSDAYVGMLSAGQRGESWACGILERKGSNLVL